MQNDQINQFSHQSSLTQVRSWFQSVEDGIMVGDTNKRYKITSNASRSPSCPFPGGGFTSIILGPTADNMCDLFNSFLEAELEFVIKMDDVFSVLPSTTEQKPAFANCNNPSFVIGFDDSMKAIKSYQLQANGQVIYTQNENMYEASIVAAGATQTCRKQDVYGTMIHEDVWNNVDTVRTGVLLTADKFDANKECKIKIPIKIDMRRFLPLSWIKYIPLFAGNLELRICFSGEGLVCAPLPIDDVLQVPAKMSKLAEHLPITNRFVQVGMPFTMVTGVTFASNVYTMTTAKQTVHVKNMMVKSCYSHLANFGLDPVVYDELVSTYTQESLSIPTRTLVFSQMSGSVGEPTCNLLQSMVPRFVEAIYLMFPKTPDHKTVFENPLFNNVSFKMGGYGLITDEAFATPSPMFYALAQNSMNTNNDIIGFNDDIMRSLTANRELLYDASKGAYTDLGFKSCDTTHFFMGFPTETDNTFQQGQTSNSPITYHFRGSLEPGNYYLKSQADGGCTAGAVIGLLKDSVFAIQVRGDGSPPIITLDEYDLTTPE